MKVLSEGEFTARVDFLSPLKPEPEGNAPFDNWPIPFEYGGCAKGTRISIAKARQIAAELRASIAEAERDELFREFKREQARCEEIGRQASKASDERLDALGEVADLKRALRKARAKKR